MIDWLLDSDPAIRWQVMRDLTDESAEAVAAERARVATEGWGAQLLAAQPANGVWGGGAYFPCAGRTARTARRWGARLPPEGAYIQALTPD